MKFVAYQPLTKEEKKQQKLVKKQEKVKQHEEKLKKHSRKMLKSSHQISFPYQIFLYRRELRKRKKDISYLRLSRSKIMMTAQLVEKNIGNDGELNPVDDIKTLVREVKYKKRLIEKVERLADF